MRTRSSVMSAAAARLPRRRPGTLRTSVVVVLFASALLVLAGCGDGNVLRAGVGTEPVTAAATPAFLARSAERTVALQTGRLEAQLTAPGVDVSTSGSFDTAARSAALAIEAVHDGRTQTADVVIAGGDLYLRPDGFAGALGEALGTPWIKAGVDELTARIPGDLEIPSVDPAELIRRLESDGITVTEVGPESVRDVPATRYRAETPADAEHRIPAATFDVWVDEAGLIRRIDVVSGDASGRVELFDLGTSVTVEVPAPSEVTDLGGLSDLADLFENLPR